MRSARRASRDLGRAWRGIGRPVRGAACALPEQTAAASEEPDEGSRNRSALRCRASQFRQVHAGEQAAWRGPPGHRPEAGITRDAIAVELQWHGHAFRLHDTAGMRRPPRVQEKLEKLSVADAIHAIRFAEVVWC